MMYFKIKSRLLLFLALSFFSIPLTIYAQALNVDASKLLAHAEVSLSPRSGSFVEGSTFQVPILLNTKGRSINGIEVRINFDQNKLLIVNPTGGTSIIGVWVEPPGFDNTRGTASYVGVVPNGITTESGLVGTITFRAKVTGSASVSIASTTKILLNDGLGTPAIVDLGRATYSILTKAPEGVVVFSDTHPVQDNWYNNNTPALAWIKDAGVSGFSLILDNKPNTIPDNTIDTEETTQSYETLDDGLLYFHIKAYKNGVWGTTGNFLLRIDTVPPAKFKPEVNYLTAATILSERTLVSFFTTDNLSGLDHYEVGIIDKNAPPTTSPVFVQSESPFQVPLTDGASLQVIIRAIDKAGNVRDESVSVRQYSSFSQFFKNYPIYILLFIILLGLALFIFHFLIGHHVVRHLRRAIVYMRRDKS